MNLRSSAQIFKALSDETRLRILHLLLRGELCVCDVMCVLRQPQSKISRHFAYLRKAGFVIGRKEGLWMYYRIDSGKNGMRQKLLKVFLEMKRQFPELEKDSREMKSKRKQKTLVSYCA